MYTQKQTEKCQKLTHRTVFKTVPHRHLWDIFEAFTCMETICVHSEDTNKDNTIFNLGNRGNNKSKYSNVYYVHLRGRRLTQEVGLRP